MEYDEGDVVHNLVLYLYLARTQRTTTFSTFLASMEAQPDLLLEDAVRAASEAYPAIGACVARCVTALSTTHAELNIAAVNHFLEIRCAHTELPLPATHFTALPYNSLVAYTHALSLRDVVKRLVATRATARGTEAREIADVINELGGVQFEAVCDTPAARALHRFVLNVLFDWRIGTHTSTALIICGTEIVTMVPRAVPSGAFICVRHFDDGRACGAEATLRCEVCRRAWYCSKACADADVRMHVEVWECDRKRCECCDKARRVRRKKK